MSQSVNARTADEVRDIFASIAARYDLLNRLMTLGRDRAWRSETIRQLNLRPGDRLLDLGTGTGGLAREALHQTDELLVVACDFTPQMINIAKGKADGNRLMWVIADAHHLPFSDEAFSAIVSGFLLRNVLDLDAALHEQVRILRHDGRIASLDTTPLLTGILRPLLEFFLQKVIPLLGSVFAGDRAAYRYLPESTERFLPAEALAERLKAAGLDGIHFIRRMFGTIAIHWAMKPYRLQHEPD
ncbi:MAG: ubiquinone/menaquinone biosynthesis methyltransferase [Anaerolineales bacterium]|nr:ubiquinone/menaquinone biosynthesis methyltransferase [Anaerolineales bacterium]